MKKLTAKELRGLVNKGLDFTLKDIETMKPEAHKLMVEATEELLTRSIKATDKEEYTMFLETLKEYTPAGAPKQEVKKVANKKTPVKKETPAPEKESQLKGNKEANILDKIKVGSKLKFRVEDEEIEHDITIVNIGKYNIIGVMADDEKEVFNIRKSDLKKQVFAWTDRHNETYTIIVTI